MTLSQDLLFPHNSRSDEKIVVGKKLIILTSGVGASMSHKSLYIQYRLHSAVIEYSKNSAELAGMFFFMIIFSLAYLEPKTLTRIRC